MQLCRNRPEAARVNAYLLWSHWLLGSLVELLDGLLVVAKILLASNENDWETLAEVKDLRNPLERVLALLRGCGAYSWR